MLHKVSCTIHIVVVLLCFLDIGCWAGKSRNRADKRSVSSVDDEDWWIVETPQQRLDKLKTYDAFPRYPEYMQQLYKVFELVGSLYSGEDLELKQMMFDKQTFRSRVQVTIDAVQDSLSVRDDRPVYTLMMFQRHFKRRYYLSFIYNSLEQLLNHDTPSLAVYDLILEALTAVDFASYELKLRDLIDRRGNSVFRNRFKSKYNIPTRGESDKMIAKAQTDIMRIDRKLANVNLDWRLKGQLDRERSHLLTTVQVSKDWIYRVELQDKLMSRTEEVVNVLTKCDLTDVGDIERSVAAAIREIQTALDTATESEYSSAFSDDLSADMEWILMLLRIYRQLIPLVSNNLEFMEYLRTVTLDRDPAKLRDEAKRETEIAMHAVFKMKAGGKCISLDPFRKGHKHPLKLEVIHGYIEGCYRSASDLSETRQQQSILSDEEIGMKQTRLIGYFNDIEQGIQPLLKPPPIRDRMRSHRSCVTKLSGLLFLISVKWVLHRKTSPRLSKL